MSSYKTCLSTLLSHLCAWLALVVLAGLLFQTASAAVDQAPLERPLQQSGSDLSAEKSAALEVDLDDDGQVSPGDTIQYRVVIENNGSTSAAGLTFTDSLDPHTLLVDGSLKISPLAMDDVYTAVGNTPLVVPVNLGLLVNDFDPDNADPAGLSVTAGAFATSLGGEVTLAADGSFTYKPALGISGVDSFIYTLFDSDGLTDTAAVTFNINQVVWYIDNTAQPQGNGSAEKPFNTVAAFQAVNDNTGSNPKINQLIFLHTGSGAYTGNLTLLQGQKLIGQGYSLAAELPPPSGVTFPSKAGRPLLKSTSGDAITLLGDNTVRGLTVGDTPAAAFAIKENSALQSNFVISDLDITGTGRLVDFSNFSGSINFDGLTSSSAAGNVIHLVDLLNGSSFTVNGKTSILSPNGTAVYLSGISGTAGFGELTIDSSTTNQTGIKALNSQGNLQVSAGSIKSGSAAALDLAGINSANKLTLGLTLDNVSAAGAQDGLILNNTQGSVLVKGGTISGSQRYGVSLNEVSGAFVVQNLTFFNNQDEHIRVNNNAGSLALTVNDNGFSDSTRGGNLVTLGGTAQVRVNLHKNAFSQNFAGGLYGTAVGNSHLILSAKENTFNDNGFAISLLVDQSAQGQYDINNNEITQLSQDSVSAITVNLGEASAPAATLSGFVRSNVISIPNNSLGAGILALQKGAGTHTAEIHQNLISYANAYLDAILVQAGPGAGFFNVNLLENIVMMSGGANSGDGIRVVSGYSGGSGAVCADIRQNRATGAPLYNLRLRQLGTSVFNLFRGEAAGISNPMLVLAINNPNLTNFYVQNQVLVSGTACPKPAPLPAASPLVEGAATDLSPTDQQVLHLSSPLERLDAQALAGMQIDQAGSLSSTITETGISLAPFSLPAGKSVTIEYQARIVDPFPAGTPRICNQGSISGSNFTAFLTDDPSTLKPNDPTCLDVATAPDLTLEKSAGAAQVEPGESLEYTLEFANSGSQDAAGVQIIENVPAHTTFKAALSSSGWSCADGSPAGTECTYAAGGLNAGANRTVTFTVQVLDPVPAGAVEISNTALIKDDGLSGSDPNPDNNTASANTPLNAYPDLSLTKSDGGLTYKPGETIPYTLSFTNRGNQGSTGVILTETVPPNTTFTSAESSSGWSCPDGSGPGTLCSLSLGQLAGGAGGSRTFAVSIDNPLPSGVSAITNTASLADDGTNGPDPNLDDNSASEITSIEAAPDLIITKSDGGIPALAGGTIAYTLTYTNTGDQAATGIVLTETVPAHTTFDSIASSPGWSCEDGSGPGTACILSLGALSGGGSSGTAFFAVSVDSPIASGVTAISNTASIADDGANGADPTPANNTTGLTTNLEAAPDLEITKSAGLITVQPGETLTYTLTYTNSGGQAATGVVITEIVPAHTAFNAGGSIAGWSCTGDIPGSVCTFAAGSLAGGGAGGSLTFAVTVESPLAAGVTSLENTVSIADDGANGADPTPANNTASTNTPVDATTDLTLSKDDGSQPIQAGEVLAYTLAYANSGSQNAAAVLLTESVPVNTRFNLASSTPGWSCLADSLPGTLCTFSLGELAGGAGGSLTFAVTVDNPLPSGVTLIQNTASITWAGTDPTPQDNTASTSTPVEAAPDLSLSKSDGVESADPGDTITYTLVYANKGSQAATGVILTETVPAHTTFSSTESSTGWSCADSSGPGTLCTLNLGTLAGGGAGGSRSFAVVVDNPLAAGVSAISNTASLADDGANGADLNPADNTASATTTLVAAPDLSLSKSDGDLTALPGDTLSYILAYANNGSQAASGVTLFENVPDNTSFNAAASTPGWSCDSGTACTFDLDELPVGAGGSVTFAVSVDDPLAPGVSSLLNTAEIGDDGSSGADANPLDNVSSTSTPVQAAPDLQIVKSDEGANAIPGQALVYSLTYANSGSQSASGVVISETIPAQTTFNAASSTSGWSCAGGSGPGALCTFDLDILPGGGAGGKVFFAVTVDPSVGFDVLAITNTASIHDDGSSGADPTPANNTSTIHTPVQALFDLSITKSDQGASALPGQVLAYRLAYANNGSRGAAGVLVTESVPAHTTFNAGDSTPGWSCAGGSGPGASCTFAVGDIAGGAGGELIFAVNIDDPVPAGLTAISNTAFIASAGGGVDPTPDDNTATTSTQVDAAPDLTLGKSDGGVSRLPGEALVFSLTYANAGSQDATGVVVAETVPANTSFVAASSTPGWSCPDGSGPGSACIFEVGNLSGGGAGGTLTFAVTIDAPLGAGVAAVSNTASIADDGSNGSDPVPGDNTASTTTPIVAAPDLSISKSDGGLIPQPGETLTYTLAYANTGSQDASGVVIHETVPAHTKFMASASTPGWFCPDDEPGSLCTYALGGLGGGASGSVTFAVTVDLPLASGVVELSNTATIADDGSGGADPTPGDNTASINTAVEANFDLSLSKSAGGLKARPGETFLYSLAYTNRGDQDASGVVITETVPAFTTFKNAVSTPGWSCPDGSGPGSLCTFSLGVVSGGASGSLTFAVSVDPTLPAGVVETTNTAEIGDDGSSGTDPTPADNQASLTTGLEAGIDLVLGKSEGGVTVQPGDPLVYTLAYTNTGSQAASGVVITETVPLHTRFDAAASSNGWSCPANSGPGVVCTYTVGSLSGGGAGASLTFAVRVSDPLPTGVTSIRNTASIGDDGANGPDLNPADNSAVLQTPLTSSADLVLSASASASSLLPGSPLALELTAANQGPQTARNLGLTFNLPAGLLYLSGPESCQVQGGQGQCSLPDLAAGASLTLELQLQTLPEAAGTLSVQFELASLTPDPNPANNSAGLSVQVVELLPVYELGVKPGDEWSSPITTTPPCGEDFLGEFGSETVSLSLENLPWHKHVTVSFDLYILRSWDGNLSQVPTSLAQTLLLQAGYRIGPDEWKLEADGQTLLHTTFSNWDNPLFRQAYPGPFPNGDNPARSGAISRNSLCYTYGPYAMDSIYQMKYTFPHSQDSLVLDFSAMGLQEIEDESWGLSNVKVALDTGVVEQPYRLFMPLMWR